MLPSSPVGEGTMQTDMDMDGGGGREWKARHEQTARGDPSKQRLGQFK